MSGSHPSCETSTGRWRDTARRWGWLSLLFTAAGLLSFGYVYLDDLARQRHGTFATRLLEQSTGAYTFFLLLPIIFRTARFYLFERKSWWTRIPLHLVAAVVISAAHTSLMAVSRHFIAPLVGLGAYDYGVMRFRYPMEFSSDFVTYTVIVALYYAYHRLRMAQAQQLAAAELRTKLAQAQLENLRLQLQPHFLFNTLNTISSVMYEDVHAADAMLGDLSELLRLTLRASRSHEIPFAEELEISRLYLELMQRRYEDKLHITYLIEPDTSDSLVPQLILQPLLENSFRHGARSGARAMEISITARHENGSLLVAVADTGAGLGDVTSSQALGCGLGLANIRHRLNQLYGTDQAISIANRAGGGTEVQLRVPRRKWHRQMVESE
jgi:two-component system LytT family sensor kinase